MGFFLDGGKPKKLLTTIHTGIDRGHVIFGLK
jgi:hypothetical protein